MAGDAEGGGCRAGHSLGIGCLIIAPFIVTDVIGVVGLRWMGGDILIQVFRTANLLMVAIGIVLGKTGVHLCHESVPVHAVTIKDLLIDLLPDIP